MIPAKRHRNVALCLASMFLLAFAGAAAAQIISTVSGNGSSEYSGDGGPALAAGHGSISGIARDGLGNIYVVENYAYRIRKISPAGTITLFAGTGQPVFSSDTETNVGDGGLATAAAISPYSVAADAVGNVYFTDQRHHRVRKITPAGIISTIAGRGEFGYTGDGGQATLARLADLRGIAVDGSGNVYISVGHAIRKIAANGIITRLAGSGIDWAFYGDGGPATSAYMKYPAGLAVDGAGNVFVADSGNGRVRRISAAGIISTVMGSGPNTGWEFEFDATQANIGTPTDVAVDSKGYVYANGGWSWIRKVSPEGLLANGGGFLCMLASCGPGFGLENQPLGDGGSAFQVVLQGSSSIEIEPGDNLLLGGDHLRVRRITATPPAVPPQAADVLKPYQLYAIDSTADAVATGDFNGDGRGDVVVATKRNSDFSSRPDDSKLFLYLQQADGTLAAPVKSLYSPDTLQVNPGLLMVDLNHDGRKDIVVGRYGAFQVYLGNPGGNLVGQDVSAAGAGGSTYPQLAVTDIDEDGNPDILLSGTKDGLNGYVLWSFRGTGNGDFQPPQFVQFPSSANFSGPTAFGDFNDDGHEDMLAGSGIFYHDGAGGYRFGANLLTLNLIDAVGAGDADDDGRADIVAARSWGVATMLLYRQDAHGRFDAPGVFGTERPMDHSLLEDMNGDGRKDLLLLDMGWGLSYLQRTATGYYQARKYSMPFTNFSSNRKVMAVGYLDGDACKDVAMISDIYGLLVFRGQNCQAPSAQRDVDKDGRSELAWLTPQAALQVWPAADRSQSVTLQAGAGWSLAAMADFSGDASADLLWRNCVNGALMRWQGLRAPARPLTVPGPDRSWRLVATADFDGNGRADMLWQHVSGATERWPDGERSKRQRGAKLAAGWTVVASGDFDGDGRADLFWRHGPTGANLIWRAGGLAGAQRVTAITDRAWQVVGSGDVDGDGRADVLWRHRLSGRNALWPSAQFTARRELQTLPDPAWTVAAMEDLDGDRRADLLWHHDSGLGLVWKRADPELAVAGAATPRNWQAFDRGADRCVPAAPASAARGRPN